MGFTEVLTLIFVTLKLTGAIDWSWWLVLLPEILAGVGYLVFLTFFYSFFSSVFSDLKKK